MPEHVHRGPFIAEQFVDMVGRSLPGPEENRITDDMDRVENTSLPLTVAGISRCVLGSVVQALLRNTLDCSAVVHQMLHNHCAYYSCFRSCLIPVQRKVQSRGENRG